MRTPIYSVRVTRNEYNASVPWSQSTHDLAAQKTRRIDHLGGFIYEFDDKDVAERFVDAIGIRSRYGGVIKY